MKKIIFALALVAGVFFTAQNTSAAGVIIYSNGQKIEVVQEVPAGVEIIEDGHVNVGVMYKQFSIFWIPIFNYGEKSYVLIDDAEDNYWDLAAEDIEWLREEHGIELPEKPKPGFWNSIGGPAIWAIVVLVLAWGGWSGRKKKNDAEIPDSSAEDASI